MTGMLAPEQREETIGTADGVEALGFLAAGPWDLIGHTEVEETRTDGKITRGSKIRLVRDGTIVHSGEIASLRRVQEDVREVAAGFECGIKLKNYNDIKEGDLLEFFEVKEVARTL